MAFDNDKMFKFLEKRANALKAGKFELANKIEHEMTDYKNKEGVLEDLTRPKMFYCTFHTEFAYSRALFHEKATILGEEVILK